MLQIVPGEIVASNAEALLSDPAQAGALESAHQARLEAADDIGLLLKRAQVWLTELPDQEALKVYERIDDAERRIVGGQAARENYGPGTALCEDELYVGGQGAALIEAGHATGPVRRADAEKGIMRRGDADPGTAGVAIVLGEDGLGRVVMPRGLQTANSNYSSDSYPLKQRLAGEYDPANHFGFLSLHGCSAGRVVDLLDERALDGVIGIGANPQELSYEAALWLVRMAEEELGLRLVIGNEIPNLPMQKDPERENSLFPDFSGQPVREGEAIVPKRLAAASEYSTVTFMQRQTEDRPDFVRIQLEMSASLRRPPADGARRTDRMREIMAVYAGYRLAQLTVKACTRHANLA